MRWLVWSLAGGGVGLALLAAGLLALIPADRVAATLQAELERVTGRKVTLSGDASARLWPMPGVRMGPMAVANAEWTAGEGPLFAAEGVDIAISLSSLFGGDIRVSGLWIDRPVILLERAEDGRANWKFGAEDGAEDGAGTAFRLENGVLRGGRLRLDDRSSGRVIDIDALDASLAMPEFSGPFSAKASGIAAGRPVSASLRGAVLSAFVEGRVVPLTATLQAGASALEFDGWAGLSPLSAEGTLVAGLDDLPALAGLFGTTLGVPLPGWGAETLALQGKLTLDGSGAAYLRGAQVQADGNRLAGDIDLIPGEERPLVVARLAAGPLVLPLRGGTADPKAAAEAGGWSQAVLDVSALGAVDAEVSLSAPSVDLGLFRLGETRGLITLDRARAVFDIRQMAAYGGTVAGRFVVNGRGGLSVGGDLALAGIGVAPLMQDLGGWQGLTATATLQAEFLGVGNSLDAILRGLKGTGSFSLASGEVRGADLGRMLRTLDPGHAGPADKTVFDGVAGSFDVLDGVVTTPDLRIAAPFLAAVGSGRIGLGSRDLDIQLRPTVLAAADGQAGAGDGTGDGAGTGDGTGAGVAAGVLVPLLISGPWTSPVFRLDMESIARERMEAEARAAEARRKAETEALLPPPDAAPEAPPGSDAAPPSLPAPLE